MAKSFKEIRQITEDADAKMAPVLDDLDNAKQDARAEIAATLATIESPAVTAEAVQVARERLAELRCAMDEADAKKQVLLRQRSDMLNNLSKAEATAKAKGDLD